ncbi:MAG: NAD(P)-dependent oxidoreductase [Chromatiales bacterium]|nr:NAD(P)-dependent oxidoreductase [Chromatiales bacterium]
MPEPVPVTVPVPVTGATVPRRVGFIGLGVMGYPMAGHLARAGHAVTVYNRTASKAAAWVREHGGQAAPSPAAASRDAEIVFTCVGDDDDLRSVVLGPDGALAGMTPGATLIDHTTASATLARELHDLAAERGLHFVDAPVSGGQSGAVNGTLTVMCGGDEAVIGAARPVMSAYARAVTRVGPAGSGQLAKMVNQICIAGLLQSLSEGIAFGEKAGLDMTTVLDVISKGAAQSWQLDNRGRTMLADRFDFGFAVKWMIKDLRMTLEEAGRQGAELPVTALVAKYYGEISRMGGDLWDTSCLVRRLR